MSVIETDIPRQNLLDAKAVATAYFSDSYRIPLRRCDMAMPELFFGIFGHHPAWIKALLIVRNRLAALCGLDVPSDAAIAMATDASDTHIGGVLNQQVEGSWQPLGFFMDF